jgi:hypothetical protein
VKWPPWLLIAIAIDLFSLMTANVIFDILSPSYVGYPVTYALLSAGCTLLGIHRASSRDDQGGNHRKDRGGSRRRLDDGDDSP